MKFIKLHPLSLIVFFASVITFTMVTMNPVLLLLSFLCAFFSVLKINKKTDAGIYFLFFLIISISNPIFSHNGETVLFYLFDQRITLEAFIYGVVAGVRIISVIYWFKLFGKVFTHDKLNWFLGKISPKLSVLFSMSLRFIPLVKKYARDIYNAQLSIGAFDTSRLSGKFKLICNVFSALVSMSIENSIETADTMRSRGLENKKRTAFSLFLFTKKDIFYIFNVIIFDVFIGYFIFSNMAEFFYYPAIKFSINYQYSVVFYTIFAILCAMPLINDLSEDLRWKYLISKI